jgi:hypothetical protein
MGMAVLSPITPGQPVHWLDWIGPVEQLGLASALCQAQATRLGATEMTTWASQAVQDQLTASGVAARHEVAKIGVPTASAVPDESVQALDWWLMSGDTDFL